MGRCIWKKTDEAWRPLSVFLWTFGILASVNLLILFLCKYPGNLTVDSWNQIRQNLTGQYSNHHPFYHTMMIRLTMGIGFRLFHDINAAVAVYSFFSVLLMAAAFAFTTATTAEMRAPKWMVAVMAAFFILMPYHIMYSMTMWKDVPFGAFILLSLVFFFRIERKLSLRALNCLGFAVTGAGVCLFRSNGFFVFAFVTLAFFLLWRFRQKKMLLAMICILVFSFILKHPVLDALHVQQADAIEGLSIPAQQIARVITDQGELTEEDRALLSHVVDLDQVAQTYEPYISDPIKNLVRAKNQEDYIREHAGAFLSLYIREGMRHPSSYLKAWIDETRGYWNAGYAYWRWRDSARSEKLGITRTTKSPALNRLVTKYVSLYTELPMLQIFVSIGFFDWLLLMALFVSIRRRDRMGVMMSVPLVMNVVSLLIATPVFAEFRYNYAVFCAMPFILTSVFRPGEEDR